MDHAAFAAQVAGNIAHIGGGRLVSWTAPGGSRVEFDAIVEDLPPDSPFYDRMGAADSSLVLITAARAAFTGALPQAGHTLTDADARGMRIRQVIRGQDAGGVIKFICGEVAS